LETVEKEKVASRIQQRTSPEMLKKVNRKANVVMGFAPGHVYTMDTWPEAAAIS
jgi:hypothetical protein